MKTSSFVGIKEPQNNSPAWKPWSGGVGIREKGHTRQQSFFAFLITGEHLQLIKRSGCVNYISLSNKKRQPLFTSLVSGYYFDLYLMTNIKKLSDKWIFCMTRLLLTLRFRNFATPSSAEPNEGEDPRGNLSVFSRITSTAQCSSKPHSPYWFKMEHQEKWK